MLCGKGRVLVFAERDMAGTACLAVAAILEESDGNLQRAPETHIEPFVA